MVGVRLFSQHLPVPSNARADAGALQSLCVTERLVQLSHVYPDKLQHNEINVQRNLHHDQCARKISTALPHRMGVWICVCYSPVLWYIRTVHLLMDCHSDKFQHRRREKPTRIKSEKEKRLTPPAIIIYPLFPLTWSHPFFLISSDSYRRHPPLSVRFYEAPSLDFSTQHSAKNVASLNTFLVEVWQKLMERKNLGNNFPVFFDFCPMFFSSQ